MANPFPSGGPPDDPLDLFEPEEPSSAPLRPVLDMPSLRVRARYGVDTEFDEPDAFERAEGPRSEPVQTTPDNVSVEVIGPPPPAGAMAFDRVSAPKGVGFVEGVAMIEAACTAAMAAGPTSGIPELRGLFLTESGDVVLHGPPTGDQPARELARLLHQLVAPNLMPPAGRLFVGRWVNGESGGLTEFASELAYFARPNGRELLVAIHARCRGASVASAIAQTPIQRKGRPRPPEPTQQVDETGRSEQVAPQRSSLLTWARARRPEATAAIAILGTAVAAGLATWIWQLNTAVPSKRLPPVSPVVVEASSSPATAAAPTPAAPAPAPQLVQPPQQKSTPPTRSTASREAPTSRTRAPIVPLSRRGTGSNQPGATAIQSQDAARGVTPPEPLPLLRSATIADLTIYSAADSGVQPPRLRSEKILPGVIKNFPQRVNSVELVVSERGEVQQAVMVGGPQRMPDMMLLSRVKELQFDPAIRNGVPVRYRLVLSWNVTP